MPLIDGRTLRGGAPNVTHPWDFQTASAASLLGWTGVEAGRAITAFPLP
jgi:hypothetical protein